MLNNDRGPVLEFQKRSGYLLLAALLGHLLLISAQVSSSSRQGVSVLEALLFGSLAQLQAGTAWVTEGVAGAWGNYVALRGHRERADRLQAELDRLGVELQHANAMARRTEQLELLLQLKLTELPATMAARVIAADPAAAFRTVTIDKGSADGVRVDMAVLSPLGVVGRVIDEPALHAAKVQLIIDRNAGAGAVIDRTGAGGVIVGSDGDTPLRMEYVSNLADVMAGDAVVTSGLDGIYPRGYAIGVVEFAQRGTGLYREIRVRPRVDFTALDTVLLVTGPQPPRATPPPTPTGTSQAPEAQPPGRGALPATGTPATTAAPATRPAPVPSTAAPTAGATAPAAAPTVSRPTPTPAPVREGVPQSQP